MAILRDDLDTEVKTPAPATAELRGQGCNVDREQELSSCRTFQINPCWQVADATVGSFKASTTTETAIVRGLGCLCGNTFHGNPHEDTIARSPFLKVARPAARLQLVVVRPRTDDGKARLRICHISSDACGSPSQRPAQYPFSKYR